MNGYSYRSRTYLYWMRLNIIVTVLWSYSVDLTTHSRWYFHFLCHSCKCFEDVLLIAWIVVPTFAYISWCDGRAAGVRRPHWTGRHVSLADCISYTFSSPCNLLFLKKIYMTNLTTLGNFYRAQSFKSKISFGFLNIVHRKKMKKGHI